MKSKRFKERSFLTVYINEETHFKVHYLHTLTPDKTFHFLKTKQSGATETRTAALLHLSNMAAEDYSVGWA